MMKPNFIPNFIKNDHIELILLNTFDQKSVIDFLIQYINKL